MFDLTNIFLLQSDPETLKSFGFKLSGGGAHISRTMMLREITQLLAALSLNAVLEDYSQAAIEQNVIGKDTQTTREKTLYYLRYLYALTEQIPIFAVFRELIAFDSQSAPLLALLVSWSRDPLLRATTPAIFTNSIGNQVQRKELQNSLVEIYPNTYSAHNVIKISQNAASSWTQSGHLIGRVKKIRTKVDPKPASMTLALILASVSGWTGNRVFSSPWCKLLDLNETEAKSLAIQAHREELITLKTAGSIVEISFPKFNDILQGLI